MESTKQISLFLKLSTSIRFILQEPLKRQNIKAEHESVPADVAYIWPKRSLTEKLELLTAFTIYLIYEESRKKP